MLLSCLAFILVATGPVQEPHVVIHYNAARELPQEAKKLLARWDEDDAVRLEKLGFIRSYLDDDLVFFYDPLAPPIQEIYQQRVLLEALVPGQAKRFGDLSPSAQRAVREILTPSVLPGHELSPDSMIGQQAQFMVKFKSGGKQYMQWGDISQCEGKSKGELQESLRSAPLVQSKLTGAELQAGSKLGSRSSFMGMRFGGSLALSYEKPTAFERCSAELMRVAKAEMELRSAAYRKIKERLEEANPELKSAHDNSWQLDDLPGKLGSTMKETFARGWKANGFESEQAAKTAWDRGIATESGISFSIGVSLQSGSPFPAFSYVQFGFTGR